MMVFDSTRDYNWIYYFMYGICNCAASSSDCTASNDAVIIVSNEFERMKKEVFIAYFKVFQSGTEENHKMYK